MPPSPWGFCTERPPGDKNTSKSLQRLSESLFYAKHINIKINDQMLSFYKHAYYIQGKEFVLIYDACHRGSSVLFVKEENEQRLNLGTFFF